MALLENSGNKRRMALGARCLVGRAGTAALLLPDRSVSAEHASVFWTEDGGWAVRDLGSRNGTFVGERRLGPGEKADLAVGDVLRFGGADEWVLRHDGPPTALAVPVDGDALDLGAIRCAQRELLALPDEDDPDITVRRHGERWVIEYDDGTSTIAGETQVTAAGLEWVVLVPPDEDQVVATTAFSSAPQPVLSEAHLRFGVSSDEEHVTLTVVVGSQAFPVKPRTHHYLLLTLARQRLDDIEAGVEDGEAGWLHADDLQRMLRMDRRALNTQVFRARRQLSELDIEGGSDIIERRDPIRQLRLGPRNIQVDRLG